ncbi:MAG: hypothetical protein HRT72_05105 [Flavobacteriales bacterium]|nr:hypothetical protein [Flavobacteriales bacterium]
MLSLKNLLAFGVLFGLTSCFYSTKYVVKYDIIESTKSGQAREEILNQINILAVKHKLQKDKKFSKTDTLGFFGSPYHYFKFWTDNNDVVVILNLKYNGSFGNRKNPPYDSLLSQLTDSLNQNFNVTNIQINEETNRKNKIK